ncbi:MAG: cupin domain-containing protein [Bacillota bacterium]
MPKYMTIDELPKPKPKIAHYTEYVTDTEYERGLLIEFGVNSETCGAKRITTGHTVIPPGSINERHVHLNAEAVMYIIKGNPIVFIGPEAKPYKLRPGCFVYTPEGVIHGIGNPSDTEEVELVFSYGGVPSKEAAGTVFIKETDGTYPPPNWKSL